MDIVNNRSNANKLLGRILFELRDLHSYGLISMEGGFKDNVITREADAELMIFAEDEKGLEEEYQKNYS